MCIHICTYIHLFVGRFGLQGLRAAGSGLDSQVNTALLEGWRRSCNPRNFSPNGQCFAPGRRAQTTQCVRETRSHSTFQVSSNELGNELLCRWEFFSKSRTKYWAQSEGESTFKQKLCRQKINRLEAMR